MAKKLYIGVDGTAQEAKNIFVGVNNIAKEVVKGYIGDENNVPQVFWEKAEEDPTIGHTIQDTIYNQKITHFVPADNYEVNNTYPLVYSDIIEYVEGVYDYYKYRYPLITLYTDVNKNQLITTIQNTLISSDNYCRIWNTENTTTRVKFYCVVGSFTISEITPVMDSNQGIIVGKYNSNSNDPYIATERKWIEFSIDNNGVTSNIYNSTTGRKWLGLDPAHVLDSNIGIGEITNYYYSKVIYLDFMKEQSAYNNVNPLYQISMYNYEFTENQGVLLNFGSFHIEYLQYYVMYYANTIEMEIGDYTLTPYEELEGSGGDIFAIKIYNKLTINSTATGQMLLRYDNGRNKWTLLITHDVTSADYATQRIELDISPEYFKNSTLTIYFDNINKGIIMHKNHTKFYESYNCNFNGVRQDQNNNPELLGHFKTLYLKKLSIFKTDIT